MKLLKVLLGIVILVPLILIATAYVLNKAVGPVGWAQRDAESRLRQLMKDPDSMVVRSSFVVQRATKTGGVEISVCGIVDGHNSFGGYSGGQRFASLSYHYPELQTFHTPSVEIEDPAQKAQAEKLGRLSAFEKVYWNSRCVDSANLPLQP